MCIDDTLIIQRLFKVLLVKGALFREIQRKTTFHAGGYGGKEV